jgi:Na+/H+ antiporter NhaC
MSNKPIDQRRFAETYGGMFGAVMPLIAMIAGMVTLSMSGLRSTPNFWSAGVLAVFVGFIIYKDKKRFEDALISGVTNRIFGFLVACLLFAGILAKILSASHLVPAMMWLFSLIHVSPSFIPLITFIICVVLSSASGTAAGTMTTVAPIMIPLGVSMGCDVNVICGAIISGAAFGDNLAPISDTTIASSLTQEVSVIKVVKSRLKYSLIAGAMAAIAFTVTGINTTNPAIAQYANISSEFASSLVFLIVPIIVVVMMLKQANLFTALLISEAVGIILLFVFGFLNISTLVAKDGLIAGAFGGMVNSIIFMMFIFIMVSLISEAGVLNALLDFSRKFAKSDKSAEIASGALVSVVSIAISSGTSAIVFCGPIIRSLLRPFKIDRARAANFLDGLGCGVGYMVPTNMGNIVLASLAVASGVVAEGYNPLEFLIYNYHCMALIVVFWFAILTGWGRKHETDEDLEADGILVTE